MEEIPMSDDSVTEPLESGCMKNCRVRGLVFRSIMLVEHGWIILQLFHVVCAQIAVWNELFDRIVANSAMNEIAVPCHQKPSQRAMRA